MFHSDLENVFNQTLRYSNKIIQVDESKGISHGYESDVKFVEDVRDIKEHSKTMQKEIFANRTDLAEEEYEFVEKTGEVHYQANIFNETSSIDIKTVDAKQRCKCGCGRAFGDPLPFCINEEDEPFFGPGIILFFFYTKRIFVVAAISALIYGVFSLVTNLISNEAESDCSDPGALAFLCDFKIISELDNKTGEDTLIIIQLILGFVFCLFWSISVRFIRAWGRMKDHQIDDRLISSSDFHIFIQNLPVGDFTQEEILEHMAKLWAQIDDANKTELKIKAVQVIYNMQQARKIINQIYVLARKLSSCLAKKNTKHGFKIKAEFRNKYPRYKNEIQIKYKQLITFRQNFLKDAQFRKNYTSECALVEFSIANQQEIFLNRFGKHKRTLFKDLMDKIKSYCIDESQSLLFKGRTIKITKAPEPSDIFWLHCEKKNSVKKTVLVWFLNFCLNGLSFGALQLLRKARLDNPDLTWLSILSIIAINLFNRLIWNVLLNIVLIEQNYTKTINVISVMNKSYVSQMINIILIPIIINMIQDDNLDGPTGLAGQVHDFQLTSFLFMTLFNLVNVPHRIVSFIRCIPCLRRFAIRYLCRVTGEFDTYAEMRDALTFLYDPPLVPVAGFYVYITSIIGQAAFFCHLQPALLFYLLINLMLFHLINRYLILRMSKITDLIDVMVFETVVGFALNVPLFYGVSSIIFLAVREDAHNFAYYIPSILCLIVWFMSVQNPCDVYQKIIDCLVNHFLKEPEQEQQEDNKNQNSKEKEMKVADQTLYCVGDFLHLDQQEEGPEPLVKTITIQALQSIGGKSISKRTENYYGGFGMNDLLNFQNRLQQVQGDFHNKAKDFCEQFTLGEKVNQTIKNILPPTTSLHQITLFPA